jgi:hypothetical protein
LGKKEGKEGKKGRVRCM